MYALLDAVQSDFTVLLLDVEWVESPDEFLTTMAAELLSTDPVRQVVTKLKAVPTTFTRWVSSVIDEVDVGAGNIGELKIRLRQGFSTEQWPELAEQMLGTLRALPGRVVLILDEFPIMVGNMLNREEASALRFLRWFRTFRQSPGTDRLTFLLGGSTNIEPRLESLASEAVLGDLQRFRIMPFDAEHSLTFVRELLAEERVRCEDGVPEQILSVCRSGVPYYLQVMVAECLAESRRLERPLVAADIKPIYNDRVVGPVNRGRFSHYHTRLRLHYADLEEPARVLLMALCGGTKTMDELRDALRGAGYDPSALERLLVMLEGDYYIVRDGTNTTFSDGLLSDWWSRNSVPPKART